MAAVYFEMKQYEDCIAQCDKGIETTKGVAYDYVKLGKIMARKANAFMQLGDFD